MDETCRLRRGERYGACADEGASIAFGESPVSRLPAKCCLRAEARTHFNGNGGNMRMGKKKTALGHAADDHEEMRMDTM